MTYYLISNFYVKCVEYIRARKLVFKHDGSRPVPVTPGSWRVINCSRTGTRDRHHLGVHRAPQTLQGLQPRGWGLLA